MEQKHRTKKNLISVLIISLSLLSFINNYRSEYPIPTRSKKLLFYIQRNLNKNTIIYDAKFDNNGFLIKDNPIDVYWIEYEKNGHKLELGKIEKTYAYGVKCSKSAGYKDEYKVKLVADEKRSFILKQVAPFKASIYTIINNKLSQLDHLFIHADNSGLWPEVKYIELFGKEIVTGNKIYEKINQL